jgi:hypothetical protein
MARIALYVPDELKTRMDAVEDQINWSDIARPAFTAAVAAFEHRKGKNMSTAIERLRASKLQADQQDKSFGNAAGRTWAENQAEYRVLRELLFRRNQHPGEEPTHALRCIMDPTDDRPDEDVAELLYPVGSEKHGDGTITQRELLMHRSDEFWLSFIEGALDFFKEVRAEVEKQPEPEQSPENLSVAKSKRRKV